MKKLISTLLTAVLLVSLFAITGTAQAATKTTFNGKTAVKGQIVYVAYKLKAPEKMEDIQGKITYSNGLKLMSASYSSKMKSGSFIHNEKLTRTIKFNSVCIAKPMDFTTQTTIVKLKFKITTAGKKTTAFTLECLDGVSQKNYGQTQNNTNFKKLSLTKTNTILTYSLKLNKTNLKLKKGASKTLKVTVTPSSASKKVSWSTSNKKVATVSSKGKVKAKRKGTCYIICKATDGSGKYKKCKIKVS